jgi:ribosomal protein L34E
MKKNEKNKCREIRKEILAVREGRQIDYESLKAHLNTCNECLESAMALGLADLLWVEECPDGSELADMVLGQTAVEKWVPGGESYAHYESVAVHVAACPECSVIVRAMEQERREAETNVILLSEIRERSDSRVYKNLRVLTQQCPAPIGKAAGSVYLASSETKVKAEIGVVDLYNSPLGKIIIIPKQSLQIRNGQIMAVFLFDDGALEQSSSVYLRINLGEDGFLDVGPGTISAVREGRRTVTFKEKWVIALERRFDKEYMLAVY